MLTCDSLRGGTARAMVPPIAATTNAPVLSQESVGSASAASRPSCVRQKLRSAMHSSFAVAFASSAMRPVTTPVSALAVAMASALQKTGLARDSRVASAGVVACGITRPPTVSDAGASASGGTLMLFRSPAATDTR